MTRQMHSRSTIPADLLERVLSRIGLDAWPEPDLDGLNTFFAAYCRHAPLGSNIRKRIWIEAGGTSPLLGWEPEFWGSAEPASVAPQGLVVSATFAHR